MLFGSTAKMAIPVELCRPQQIQQAHVSWWPAMAPAVALCTRGKGWRSSEGWVKAEGYVWCIDVSLNRKRIGTCI